MNKYTIDCDEMHFHATKPKKGRFQFDCFFFLDFSLVSILTTEKKLHALESRNEKKWLLNIHTDIEQQQRRLTLKFIIASEFVGECMCLECAHMQNKYGVELDCHCLPETSCTRWGAWLFTRSLRATQQFEFICSSIWLCPVELISRISVQIILKSIWIFSSEYLYQLCPFHFDEGEMRQP